MVSAFHTINIAKMSMQIQWNQMIRHVPTYNLPHPNRLLRWRFYHILNYSFFCLLYLRLVYRTVCIWWTTYQIYFNIIYIGLTSWIYSFHQTFHSAHLRSATVNRLRGKTTEFIRQMIGVMEQCKKYNSYTVHL